MTWSPNFKKGTDFPVWDWLSMFPAGNSNPGTSNCYDGARWMYWAVQTGTTTAGTAGSTTVLYRYDTWTDGWQFLANLTSGNNGIDMEYDATRNVVYYIVGAATPGTALQVFNLNTTAVTINNVSCAAFAVTTLAVLPIAAGAGASLTMPDETQSAGNLSAANAAVAIDSNNAAQTGTTTTTLISGTNTFGPGMVGLYARFTSGALVGQRRQITAVPGTNTLTVAAFGATPTVGDTWVVEVPEGTATSATVSTLVDTGQAWITNLYANNDVAIVAGTGAGQRRRIASNTATTLTLAAAVTGNARTGNWATTPDATSVYRIIPSSDFLYYQPGAGGTGIYRLDVVQTTGSAWSASIAAAPGAPGGGANTMYAGAYDPFSILMARGGGTNNIFRFTTGPGAWSTLTTWWGSETITTGASVAMLHGLRRMFIQKEGSQRCYALDLTTGMLEVFGFAPYAAPSATDGHRARYVTTADGVRMLYLLRAGSSEFFRVPVEWLP